MNDVSPSDSPAANDDARKVRQVELLISTLLRVGVIVSLAVVILGTVITYIHHPDFFNSPEELNRLTKPGAAFPHTLREVVTGIGKLHGRAIVVAGLLLLVATPVVRVAVSIFAFVYEHDRVFVVITSIVLAMLLLSFVLGKAGG